MLELTDYAPLPVREPVRSLVWVRGRLREVPPDTVAAMLDLIATEHPDPALLQVETPRSAPTNQEETWYTPMRLEVATVVVADPTGAEAVRVTGLLGAQPDPFCEIESDLLRHLATAHSDVVAVWCPGCPRRCAGGGSTRWAWTGTAFGFASKPTTGIATSGCPSPRR